MKRFLLGAAVTAALAVMNSANAADLEPIPADLLPENPSRV